MRASAERLADLALDCDDDGRKPLREACVPPARRIIDDRLSVTAMPIARQGLAGGLPPPPPPLRANAAAEMPPIAATPKR